MQQLQYLVLPLVDRSAFESVYGWRINTRHPGNAHEYRRFESHSLRQEKRSKTTDCLVSRAASSLVCNLQSEARTKLDVGATCA